MTGPLCPPPFTHILPPPPPPPPPPACRWPAARPPVPARRTVRPGGPTQDDELLFHVLRFSEKGLNWKTGSGGRGVCRVVGGGRIYSLSIRDCSLNTRRGGYKTGGGGGHVKFYPCEKGGGGRKKF